MGQLSMEILSPRRVSSQRKSTLCPLYRPCSKRHRRRTLRLT